MPTTIRSFSKINLGLAIGPVRADGFHGLTTLYQTLAAHDLVTVSARPATATRISLTCNIPRVPCDDRNTAFKAVRLALESIPATAEVSIHIEKRLPVQGGMGAGSANAAAALLALDQELRASGITPPTPPERLRIAALVGSDVPLFLIGGAVLGLGRGEEVYPMPDLPATPCVVALPEIGVSTPQAFRDWDARYEIAPHQDAPHGTIPERDMRAPYASWNVAPTAAPPSAAQLTHASPSRRLNMLSRSLASAFCEPHSSGVFALGADLAEKTAADLFAVENPLLALVRTGIENDFEEVVFPQNPLFGIIKRALAAPDTAGYDPENAAIYAALSGSGSALFGLYVTEAAADAAEERLAKIGVRSMRTELLQREEYWRRLSAVG
ncbi:MAG TPA: 4-(cytidine 5'-diphospho)-2-C-methyl-D-erythritol kinase [Acidobacteriaceae bacterium]|nr:4-(cytidine 5'-diphospho)-2-C-methyl-D-erythritol kinase [Acidobacteriaceae bacterium]